MDVMFIAGFATIVKDPAASRAFYQGALGLPLETVSGDYIAVDGWEGTKHFGVWPLANAAQSCFGSDTWPDDVPAPNASIEFEVASPEAVAEAVTELTEAGHTMVHDTRTEPWGQTIARLLDPDGVLVGISYAPWFHQEV